MSAVITVSISRSAAWVRAQSIARCTGVPSTVDVAVDVADLSEDVRTLIYDYSGGRYPEKLVDLRYLSDFKLSTGSWHGREDFEIDGDTPTTAQVNDAIAAAYERIKARKVAAEIKKAEKEEAERASAAAWAALPLDHRATSDGIGFCVPLDAPAGYAGPLSPCGSRRYEFDAIKKYQPEALAQAQHYACLLKAKADAKRLTAGVETLSEFLANVPEDALRGALKRMAASEEAIVELIDKIEKAASIALFGDDEE